MKVLIEVSDTLKKALSLVDNGYTPFAAAKEVGIHKLQVYRAIKYGIITAANGVDYIDNDSYRIWKNAINVYLNEKLTLLEFAKRFKSKPDVLLRNLQIFAPGNELHDLRKAFNRSIFHTIDSEEKAYWYGFILADGGIFRSELRIKLGEKDLYHLHKFCSFMELDPCIAIKKEIHSTTGNTLYKVVLSSAEIVSDLRSHGIDYRKSGYEKVPPFALCNDALAVAFLRGAFDGDGCIRSNFAHCNYIGSQSMVQFFSETCQRLGNCKPAKIYDCETYFKAYWYSDKTNMLKLLYTDATVYLTRKLELAKRYGVLVSDN